MALFVFLSGASCTGNGCSALLLPGQPDPGTALTPGDHWRSLVHDGQERRYKLHVPPQYVAARAMPLVFMLHGGFGSGEQASRHYGWNEKADADGFLVAYPDGTGMVKTWNAVHCCGAAKRNDVDDVGFIAAIVDDLRTVATIDTKRIYAAGMSNGGMLAHRLAAERGDLFAAIAPVAGSFGGQENPDTPVERPPAPRSPVAVCIIHGTADMHVLYDGGETVQGAARGRVDLSVQDAVDFWVNANGCETTAAEVVLAAGDVIQKIYAHQGNGADVVLYTVIDQGHAWPGGQRPRSGADEPSASLDATAAIWEFFRHHPKP